MFKIYWKWICCGLLALGIGIAAFALEMAPDDGVSTSESDEPLLQTEEVMPLPNEVPQFTPLNPKWSAPVFTGQENALGWTPEAFNVPHGMEDRVQFWKDIYTKYTANQGLLHDSQFVNVIYESVDFGDITAQGDLTDKQREKARRKRVNERKKEISARLKRLGGLKGPEGLTGEDLRYWEMFSKIDQPKKFQEAGKKGRLRFQLGQRSQFINGIYSSGRYIKQMEEIFRKEGVPLELTRLPFVESSFNLRARSRVGASGIWQFMRSTARMYMRLDSSADERNDPLRATVAAAKKMRDNFTMLKSWPLAVTAYNHGPSGVKRLTEKMGTTDLAELTDVRRGRFGFASASFYASFLAALDVERNAEKYFGVLEVMPEVRGAEIKLVQNKSWKDMAKWFNNDIETAKLLNPHVAEAVWKGKAPLTRKHSLRVPLTQESQARAELE